MLKIRKAVFPVAGLGTRFLPATKASPKEMLPIVDKPLLQYAAEEAVAAGINTLIFIIGRNKGAIPDHFDKAYELEKELEKNHKLGLLSSVQNILPENVNCIYIRQAEAKGFGDAVLCADPVVGNEPFAVILADDLVHSDDKSCIQQMVELYEKYPSTIIGAEQIPQRETYKYGIMAGQNIEERIMLVDEIVEKPAPENAPSNLAVVGRYILTPGIFDKLKSTPKGVDGEVQLTDAIAKLRQEEKVYAYQFAGKRYDCGSKLGYLQANVEYGLRHDGLREEFKTYIKSLDLS